MILLMYYYFYYYSYFLIFILENSRIISDESAKTIGTKPGQKPEQDSSQCQTQSIFGDAVYLCYCKLGLVNPSW